MNTQELLKNIFIESCKNGYLTIVKQVAESGFDIHIDDDLGLQCASADGRLEVVKYLVEQGANIHAFNNCAIKWAERNKHTDVVKYLKGLGNES